MFGFMLFFRFRLITEKKFPTIFLGPLADEASVPYVMARRRSVGQHF